MKIDKKFVIIFILFILLLGISTVNAISTNNSISTNTLKQTEPVINQDYNNKEYVNKSIKEEHSYISENQKDNITNTKVDNQKSHKALKEITSYTYNINNNQIIPNESNKIINTSHFEMENNKYINTTTLDNKTEIKENINENSSCCSVVIQVSDKESLISFRRDSTYQATINIIKTKWYGVNITKQYKTVGTYFVHAIVTSNGWVMGFGGADKPVIQSNIVSSAGEMFYKNSITNAGMRKIYNLLVQLGIGHTVIKAPDGRIGIAIYNKGGTYFVSKLSNGEYVSVPNSLSSYRRGYYTRFSIDPVNAGIKIAGTDRYGINRREIISYHNIVSSSNQLLKIYATDDTGKLLNRRDSGLKDPINCFGKYYSTNLLPVIPNKLLIGTINAIKTEIPTTYNITPFGKNKTNNINNVINLINKFGQNNRLYTINLLAGTYNLDQNTTLSLYNTNIKNITVLFKGIKDNTVLNGNNNDILKIESNFNVKLTNITFVNNLNGKAIYNKGNLEILYSNLIDNNNQTPTIYNTGTLLIESSAFTSQNAIYNNGTVKSINNNWWNTNNPNWNKLLVNIKKPSKYVIMTVYNITTYENNKIKIKITFELNNRTQIKELPEQKIKIISNNGQFSPEISKIKDEIITTYIGNPGKLNVTIGEQTIELVIKKPQTEITLNPTASTTSTY